MDRIVSPAWRDTMPVMPAASGFPERRPSRPRDRRPVVADTAWEDQARWYEARHGSDGDDFHSRLILPAVRRQLAAKRGQTVLDIGCGTGLLGRALRDRGVRTLGVDASPAMIAAARRLAGPDEEYLCADAHALGRVLDGRCCDHAALVLVLQDLDPIADVLAGAAAHVAIGGRLVVVLTHPCLRIPRLSSWGWDDQAGIQYRRLDGYLSPQRLPIKTHPGRQQDHRHSSSHHRPLSSYLNALGGHGWAVVACEELTSHRRGTKGPRFAAEDRACREFPVFLVLTACRVEGAEIGKPKAETKRPKPDGTRPEAGGRRRHRES